MVRHEAYTESMQNVLRALPLNWMSVNPMGEWTEAPRNALRPS
jgi:hypothetical protein